MHRIDRTRTAAADICNPVDEADARKQARQHEGADQDVVGTVLHSVFQPARGRALIFICGSW